MIERVSAERLRELLRYDAGTGVFYWRNDREGGVKAGAVAGCLTSSSRYCRINIDRRSYRAHILAWLYVTGTWPAGEVDHINGDGADNRFANLRAATHRQNMANQRIKRNNTSGFKGVSWHKAARKWHAYIRVNYKMMHLGLFDTPEAAHAAYCAAAERHWGEFARAA